MPSEDVRPSQPNIPTVPEQKENWNRNVLLADDTDLVRNMTIAILKRLGCTVEAVINGKQLIDRLGTAKPGEFGLIITDKEMPEMGGMEVMESIKSNPSLKNLPVMLYSGDTKNEAEATKVTEALGYLYLAKPFTIPQLQEAINKSIAKFKSTQ